MDRALSGAFLGLLFNMAFGAYHIVAGAVTHSWWLFTLGIYYALLSILRFVVLLTGRSNGFLVGFTGVMLMILSLPLVGTVILSIVEERGKVMHEILMIAMAVYAFTKITLALINLIRSRKHNSAKHIVLRNVSFADACVSIFALQRSMLVSFGDMPESSIRIFNAVLGAAVCAVVFLLGLGLLMELKRMRCIAQEGRTNSKLQ